MSDFASVITQPLWEATRPRTVALLREEGWTEIIGSRSALVFAVVLADLSPQGIRDQVSTIAIDIAELEEIPEADFSIWLIDEAGASERISVNAERAVFEAWNQQQQANQAKYHAMAERAERDRRESEGTINPDLDVFLATASKEEVTVEPQGLPEWTDAEHAAFLEALRIHDLPVTVAQLITALGALPQNAKVSFLYDGFITCPANAVWLARSGDVIIGQAGETVYSGHNHQPDGVESGDWDPPPFDGADP